jgi:hypothetical protein
MTTLSIIIISALTGSLLTTGVLLQIDNRSQKWEEVQNNQAKTISDLASLQSKIESDKLAIQKGLTAPDLLDVACSAEYMGDNGDLLCREMFCRLQTREGDGASQSECEIISNIANSLTIMDYCINNNIELKTCSDIVDRRK